MGDNRDNSKDSRFYDFGTIPFSHIIGRAEYIYLSFNLNDQNILKLHRSFKSLMPKNVDDYRTQ